MSDVDELMKEFEISNNTEIWFTDGETWPGMRVNIDEFKAKINRLIKLAKKEERNRLTHQQIDSKIISSDDFKIEFELKFTDEPEHKYVFASSPKGFQVAVDGKNIVSKLSNNLSKGKDND